MEDDEIRSTEDILGNLFMGGKISIPEFKFLQVNMNSDIANIILLKHLWGKVSKWTNKNRKTIAYLETQLLCLMNCKLEKVPLYISTPFDDIIKYRLTYQI